MDRVTPTPVTRSPGAFSVRCHNRVQNAADARASIPWTVRRRYPSQTRQGTTVRRRGAGRYCVHQAHGGHSRRENVASAMSTRWGPRHGARPSLCVSRFPHSIAMYGTRDDVLSPGPYAHLHRSVDLALATGRLVLIATQPGIRRGDVTVTGSRMVPAA